MIIHNLLSVKIYYNIFWQAGLFIQPTMLFFKFVAVGGMGINPVPVIGHS